MPTYLYSYSQASQGSRALAEALGVRRLRHERSTFHGGANKTVINWGSSSLPENTRGSRIINDPMKVAEVCDKLRFFNLMNSAPNPPRIPLYTTNSQTALGWIENGGTVCIRSLLRSSGAAGLTIVNRSNLQDFVDAPLYTEYVNKRDEYRVHIVRGDVIDVQRKALRNDIDREEANWQIRNLKNGFIFARNENREVPEDVITQALRSMEVSGLDFGAVDVLYRERDSTAWVLEVNTAPGLVNSTLENYSNALKALI